MATMRAERKGADGDVESSSDRRNASGMAPFFADRRRRRVWLFVGFALWVASVGLHLDEARASGMAGRDQLQSLAALVDDEELDLDLARGHLEVGAEELDRADRALSSPVLWPIRVLPFVGRQLSVVQAGAAGGADVSARALDVFEVTDELDEAGAIDAGALVSELARAVRALEQAVVEADRGPSSLLVEPFASLQEDYAGQIDELEVDVIQLRTIVDALEAFLASDNYLTLGSNNAEMRLGAGMPLGIGELVIGDGEFEFGGFQPSWSAIPPKGIEILDPDMAARWGFLSPTDDFRKLTYSARFDEVVAPQALEMWEAETGRSPDGVLLVDPVALVALLEVVGSVEVDGQLLDSETALDYILKEQYQRYGARIDEVQSTREDALSAISAAAVAKFGEGGWDPVVLLRSLQPAARGRHIMMFSPDPVQQAGWQAAGIDGAVPPNSIGVFLLNLGASKLDPYMSIGVETTTGAAVDGGVDVRSTVTIRNDADGSLSPFSLGTWAELGLSQPGSYNGRLALYLPAGITDVDLPRGVTTEVFGPDGNVLVAAWRLVIAPGSTTTIDFSYVLPEGDEPLHVLPSARSPAIEWSWNGQTFLDDRPTVVMPSP